MEVIFFLIFKLISIAVLSIFIAYYAEPVQLIKKWTGLNKVKLFNCAFCLSPYITFAVFYFTSTFAIIQLLGLCFVTPLVVGIIQRYFVRII